mmetsp:Transcript_22451/g.34192  ORF Transcript_22451/g.34192 Transcript_22451/m.34192 type:complete len:82 (+) Transcript_22451:262-507(+)
MRICTCALHPSCFSYCAATTRHPPIYTNTYFPLSPLASNVKSETGHYSSAYLLQNNLAPFEKLIPAASLFHRVQKGEIPRG